MLINSRSELKDIISYERQRYRLRLFDYLTFAPKASIFWYVKLLRKCEYYKLRAQNRGVEHSIV